MHINICIIYIIHYNSMIYRKSFELPPSRIWGHVSAILHLKLRACWKPLRRAWYRQSLALSPVTHPAVPVAKPSQPLGEMLEPLH